MNTRYAIERLLFDHPGLWSDSFRVCAVARCREFGASPWPLDLARDRPLEGSAQHVCIRVLWGEDADGEARKATATFQANRLTEDAAIGMAGAVFAALREGRITEVTQHGDGVDYWVDDRRAVLEVSGIRRGEATELRQRRREKLDQLAASSLAAMGVPGYVFVVLFSQGEAALDYRPPEGGQH